MRKDINEYYNVYGVTFSFDGNTCKGIRLCKAKQLSFYPSSNSEEGIDDFYNIEDSPFHTRKCIREYIDEKATYTFEDTDPEKYNILKANKTGARMVAFPKFYYRRHDEWTFLVSSKFIPGFEISPAHCKRETINGPLVVYDYVYISEFMVNSNGDISQPGCKPMVSTDMDEFRRLAKAEGMYVEDISCRMMVTMLAIIKYASLDGQFTIGNGHSGGDYTDIQYDDILGHDGYRTSKTDNTSIKVMDLVDFYANAWEFIEGCYIFNNEVYINNDTKTIIDYPNKDNYKQLGWKSTGIIIPFGLQSYFTNIAYNMDYKYLMVPQIVPGRPNPFGDRFFHSYSDDGYLLLLFGGGVWNGASDGLFCWSSYHEFFTSSANIGARFVAFGSCSLL